MRRLLIPSALAVVSLVLALTVADASVHRERVHVRPSSGSPNTVFVLTFRVPERTGRHGAVQRDDMVSASAARGSTSCIESIDVRAPDAAAGARVRVSLDPGRLGGRWCRGRYDGRVEELQRPACARGAVCPAYVVVRGVIGRFTLQVEVSHPSTGGSSGTPPSGPPPPGMPPPGSGTDTVPPSFAGLQSAYACTPGPQRPGETTPYTLTWQAATDDMTPSSEIVYDVFLASAPGNEDFSHPTWTTAPGVTSYKTPGLPSHGTYYFVVRARDQAGNEDQNKVERRGSDPCY
jgi:hypothetical protein